MKKKYFILLFLVYFILFSFIDSIKADPAVSDDFILNNQGYSQSIPGGCGAGLNQLNACVDDTAHFRITLVDTNGVKMAGTNSIDIASYYSPTDSWMPNNSAVVDTLSNISGTLYIKNMYGKYYGLLNGDKYNYKYGENSSSKFKYIKLFLTKDYASETIETTTRLTPFYDEFVERLGQVQEGKKVIFDYHSGQANTSADLLSVILYHMGFLKEQKSIFDAGNEDLLEKLSGYYLLCEPTFTVYYNLEPSGSDYFKYGTGIEIVKFIYNQAKDTGVEISRKQYKGGQALDKGLFNGLNWVFYSWAFGNLYTLPNDDGTSMDAVSRDYITDCRITDSGPFFRPSSLTDLKEYEKGSLYSFFRQGSASSNYEAISDLLENDKYKKTGYGASSISLATIGVQNNNVTFDLNQCSSDTVSFKKTSDSVNYDYIQTEYFKVGEEPNVYCYDNVVYDFSSLINSLNSGDGIIQKFTKYNFSPIKTTINRVCYSPNTTFSLNFGQYKLTNNYRDEIKLYLNKKEIIFKKQNNPKIIENNNLSVFGSGSVTFTIEFDYVTDDSLFVSDSFGSKINASIVFSENEGELLSLVGYSSNILKNLIKNDELSVKEGLKTYKYSLDNKVSSNNISCNYSFEVDESSNDYSFRVISLENPFPARNGYGRLAGINWLNTDNNVDQYILNNRGIRYITRNDDTSPEDMYSIVEPMYSVTLDASSMVKIRNYNKTHPYINLQTSYAEAGSSSKIYCDSEGRECYSAFLRDPAYISQSNLSGTCVLVKNKPMNTVSSFSDISNVFQTVVNSYNIVDRSKNQTITVKNDYSKSFDEFSNIVDASNGAYNDIYDYNKNHKIDTEDSLILINKDKNTQFYTCANKTFASGGPYDTTDGGGK